MLRLIAMDATDARRLSADAQEDLRRRVVRAVKRGMSKAEAVRTFGVSKTAVFGWIKAVRRGGERIAKYGRYSGLCFWIGHQGRVRTRLRHRPGRFGASVKNLFFRDQQSLRSPREAS